MHTTDTGERPALPHRFFLLSANSLPATLNTLAERAVRHSALHSSDLTSRFSLDAPGPDVDTRWLLIGH